MPEDKQPLAIVLAVSREMGECFLHDACTSASGNVGELKTGDSVIRCKNLGGEPRLNPDWDGAVLQADQLILLVRFMDVISLDKMKGILKRLPSEQLAELAVFFYREKSEKEFKISCMHCGQKLWVSENNEGRRGRCPNCKKAFMLETKVDLLRSRLGLPEATVFRNVILNDKEICQQTLKSLLRRKHTVEVQKVEADDDVGLKPIPGSIKVKATKNSTIPINLGDDA